MRLALRSFYIALFGAFCFFVGTQYEWWSHWSTYPVTVTITNASGQPLKSLTLSHYGSGLKGMLDIEPPQAGDSRAVRYFQPGEGGFTIEATFVNGRVLKAAGGYVEAGYSFDKIITATDIR